MRLSREKHAWLYPADSAIPLKKWLQSSQRFTANRFQAMGSSSHLWLRSGRDRVCRSNEAAEFLLTCIVNNRFRAGLKDDWSAWPWTRVFIPN